MNTAISKLENYVDQKFDEAAMKYLKETILSDIKQQFSDVTKAKDCSQLLIDSLKDQNNSLQNEIQFLRGELKVKNHLLELTITSKKSTPVILILPARKSATTHRIFLMKKDAAQSISMVIIISR